MKRILSGLLWLWQNPFIIVVLVALGGWWWIGMQADRIDGLKDKVAALEAVQKHNNEVINYLVQKGEQDDERAKFKAKASNSAAQKRSGERASPALSDAYNSLWERYHSKAGSR